MGLKNFLLLSAFLVVSAAAKISEDLEYVGRYDFSNDIAKAMWPGSGIKFNALSQGSTTEVTVNYLNIQGVTKFFIAAYVNCALYKTYEISPNAASSISIKISTEENSVQEFSFIKITESNNGDALGVMEIGEVTVDGGNLLTKSEFLSKYKSSCAPKPYNMLVVGDSITAAYGVDGTDCTFSASTENVNDGYAALVAEAVGANAHIIPWSGKGVVRNYGDSAQMSAYPMPVYYNKTLATLDNTDANYWNPSLFTPDVVLVMLGTNDYSTIPRPTDDQFQTGLVNLLNRIKYDYPTAKVAAMCAPMRADRQCLNIEAGANTAGVTYVDIDPSAMDGGVGCDWHPSVQSQKNIASYVTPAVRKMLGI